MYAAGGWQPVIIVPFLVSSAFAPENSSWPTGGADELQLIQTRVNFATSFAAGLSLAIDASSAKPAAKKGATGTASKKRASTRPIGDGHVGRDDVIHGGTHGEERSLYMVAFLIMLSLWLLTMCHLSTEKTITHAESEPVSALHLDKSRASEGLDGDITGLLIFSLIDDSHAFANRDEQACQRIVRLFQAFGFLILTFFLQLSILYFIQEFCCAEAVYTARQAYSTYELAMVGGNVNYTTMTEYGEYRAMEEHFDPAFFDTIDAVAKKKICNIPFSQPLCLQIVLLLWTFTCCLDYRRCMDYFWELIIYLPTVDSMRYAIQMDEDVDGKKFLLVGITLTGKNVIYWVVLAPRVLMALIMMWQGCRWLAATADFSDLVLNACALELILGLKDLLYGALVSKHTKIDIRSTELFLPNLHKKRRNYLNVTGVCWGLLSCAWTWYYIYHFQSVLPGYRFDVARLCFGWISERYGWLSN